MIFSVSFWARGPTSKMAVELTMTFRPKVVLAFDRLEEPGTFIRAQGKAICPRWAVEPR
jgi:hypothetical protein